MGKRKINTKDFEKKKRAREEQDSELDLGLFKTDTAEPSEREKWDNEEQDYELKPRHIKHAKEVVEGLPIKTADGKVERVVREVQEEVEEPEAEVPVIEEPKEEVEDEDAHLTPSEKLVKLKEEIAELASKLMDDPEENIHCLTKLRKMSESHNPLTSQLAIMALIPVFKAIAPSYRIRLLTDTEKREKVGKEVARVRQFEQGLVKNYTMYVDNLSKMARVSYSNSQNNKKVLPIDIKKGLIAVKAACELSTALRYFNYRNEVFTIVVRRLNRKPTNAEDLEVFTRCLRVLETLFNDDEDNGDITDELVRTLCKSIVDKKFRVDESVVNVFLSLSLLKDYDPNQNKDAPKPKQRKKDRVHLSKKERKNRKERLEIEDEMRKAKQQITAEEREKYQSKVLKMLLTLYLQMLKAGSQTTGGEASHLMAAVLEGLAKFGEMANFDLLGDFMEVLREIMYDIIEEHSLGAKHGLIPADQDDDDDVGGLYDGKQLRTILLCIATSFTLLLNHLSTGKLPISVDLSRFVTALYQVLADIAIDCDLEFGHKTFRLVDPLSSTGFVEKPSVNVSTKAELLLRCLDFIFFRSKNGTSTRATSFTKRLYMSALNTPEKTSLATLKFIGKLVGRHGESIKGLWNTEERISGEGQYVLGIERADREVELARDNAGAATLWENVLLDKHYSPMVREGAKTLMNNSK